ncbi:LADA_0F01794g1_1 [Lachancea dasiensis]|uniref:Elongin-A n=1 Tax=Lachancea dasiensis TaxID=1072105 RepID=A0A1G4JIB5_9SACH|nr:LADA_0F01794g1_1 [Lachancea dasiensis]
MKVIVNHCQYNIIAIKSRTIGAYSPLIIHIQQQKMNEERLKVSSLRSICEVSLMRNHLAITNVANVPYRLIRNVLMKLKVDHLCKLEETNVLLIFEDEEIWRNLLAMDFPLHVGEAFQRKRDEIMAFYVSFVELHDPGILRDADLMRGFLRFAIKKDPESQKYRVPSRMLYFQYQEEMLRKQELSTQRLRMRMQELHDEKQKNQIVALEDPVFCEKRVNSTSKISERSSPFVKSFKEHQKRQQHFKSGGFDITKRPVKRVAFGGQVGSLGVHNCSKNEAKVVPAASGTAMTQTSTAVRKPTYVRPKQPDTPPRAKRQSNEPNPFLKRRKPPSRPKPLNASTQPVHLPQEKKPGRVKLKSTKIKRSTKSSIFTTPSPQDQIFDKGKDRPNAYIFDSPQR